MPGPGKNPGDSQVQRKSTRIQEKKLSTTEDVNSPQNYIDGLKWKRVRVYVWEVRRRHGTGTWVATAESSTTQTTQTLDDTVATGKQGSVHEKLDRIMTMLEGVVGRLDKMETRLSGLEAEYNVSKGKIESVEQSLEFVTKEVEDLKEKCTQEQENKVTREALEKRCEDLENRSTRNNLVFWGIPEGSEDQFENCAEFVVDLLKNTTKIERADEIETERAHRTPSGRKARAQFEQTAPRPIHIAFLRFQDRDRILRSAASALKGKRINGKVVYVTDDVSKSVRADCKKLIPTKNKLRAQGLFAVIPYSVPAHVLYKSNKGNFKKIFVKDVNKSR